VYAYLIVVYMPPDRSVPEERFCYPGDPESREFADADVWVESIVEDTYDRGDEPIYVVAPDGREIWSSARW